MQISSNGLNILKNREKLRLKAYQDSGKVWTIGYGATTYESGTKVKEGDTITEARAIQLLSFHVGVAAAAVNKYISATLTQGQFDALTSFVYNTGAGAFSGSTLRKLVNADPNNFKSINAEFLKWVYVTLNGVKVKVDGLINRRNEEIQMYSGGSGSLKKKAGSRS